VHPEVPFVDAIGEVVPALPAPEDEVFVGEEDVAATGLAARAAAGAIEGLARVGIDRVGDRARQLRIERHARSCRRHGRVS
jgi:hypothetical protein